MILTPIPLAQLPATLARFAASLAGGFACGVFAAIAQTSAERARGPLAEQHRREALALAAEFGMEILEGSPAQGFSWDGRGLRADTEAYVLLHEIAHYQLASPERRGVVDFGLGPGPDTGDRAAAERAAVLSMLERDREEAAVSLLGILWETALGHPALASFLDQNWLEGAGGDAAARHFTTILDRLHAGGFVDAAGRPTRRLRMEPDERVA
jgi:hypothetical protein